MDNKLARSTMTQTSRFRSFIGLNNGNMVFYWFIIHKDKHEGDRDMQWVMSVEKNLEKPILEVRQTAGLIKVKATGPTLDNW